MGKEPGRAAASPALSALSPESIVALPQIREARQALLKAPHVRFGLALHLFKSQLKPAWCAGSVSGGQTNPAQHEQSAGEQADAASLI